MKRLFLFVVAALISSTALSSPYYVINDSGFTSNVDQIKLFYNPKSPGVTVQLYSTYANNYRNILVPSMAEANGLRESIRNSDHVVCHTQDKNDKGGSCDSLDIIDKVNRN